MHRLATIPGGDDEADAKALIEQPPAAVLLLSSADTDLLAIDQLLASQPELLGCELRALNLAGLAHPAVVDHYLASTGRHAQLVVVRCPYLWESLLLRWCLGWRLPGCCVFCKRTALGCSSPIAWSSG